MYSKLYRMEDSHPLVGCEVESGCDSVKFMNEITVVFRVDSRAVDRLDV
jgi:hypothetical protein